MAGIKRIILTAVIDPHVTFPQKHDTGADNTVYHMTITPKEWSQYQSDLRRAVSRYEQRVRYVLLLSSLWLTPSPTYTMYDIMSC